MHPDRDIELYVAEGLPPAAEERLRTHLARCAHCRARYDERVLLMRALAGDPGKATAAEDRRMAARALSGFRARPHSPGRADRVVDGLLWLRGPRLATAGALAAAAVVLVIWTRPPPARLVAAEGVQVDGELAAPGDGLSTGARVQVAVTGVAELTIARGGTIRVFPGATVTVGARGELIELERGRVWCQVDHNGRPFAVRTDRGEARVLGTSFVVEKSGDGDTEVRVQEGTVAVEDRDHRGTVEVHSGQKTRLRARAAPTPPRGYSDRDRSDWVRSLENFLRKVGRGIEKAVDDVKKKLK